MSGSQSRRGLTLIEVLVVLAIVMTLVLLVMPAVRHARRVSQSTACGNQLRRIGMAIMTYGNQTGYLVPCGVTRQRRTVDDDPHRYVFYWRNLYESGCTGVSSTYNQPGTMWDCPSNPNVYSSVYHMNYGYNLELEPLDESMDISAGERRPLEMAGILGDTVLVGDVLNQRYIVKATTGNHWSRYFNPASEWMPVETPLGHPQPGFWHLQEANLLHRDLSVSARPAEQMRQNEWTPEKD